MFMNPSTYQQPAGNCPQYYQHLSKPNINTNVFRKLCLNNESFPLINTLYY